MQYGILENLVYLGGNAFRIYTIFLFFRSFFKSEASIARQIIRSLCYMAYFCLNSIGFLFLHWSPTINLVLNFIGIFILAVTYNSKWKTRVGATVSILAIQLLCEDLTYRMLLSLNIKHLFIIGITVSGLLSFMVVIFLQGMVDFRRGENFSWQEWVVIIFIPSCSMFLSAFVFDNCENEGEIAAGGISMILLNIFLFYLLNRIFTMHKEQLQLLFLEQQNQAYEDQIHLLKSSNDKISSLRHDMHNHFLVLHQLAQKDSCKDIQAYLESLDLFFEQQGAFSSTGNLVIDGLINLKANEAVKCGTEVGFDISISKDIRIDKKDLCILLGNLLDNALRALGECENVEKVLTLKMRECQGVLAIQIENSYNGSVKRVGNYFRTTKEEKENHGIGLKIVERVVNEYKGELKIQAGKDLFRVEILMYLINKF